MCDANSGNKIKFDFTITFTNMTGFIVLMIGVYALFARGMDIATPLFTVGATLITGGKIVNMFEKNNEKKLEFQNKELQLKYPDKKI